MQKDNQIIFAGYRWKVKEAEQEKVGPGPNYFSSEGVWVDHQNHLHLTIKNYNSHFRCSEVILDSQTGYGVYTVVTSSNIDKLNPFAILGIFTYESDTKQIDIEWSRWGQTTQCNCQFVIQPPNQQSFIRYEIDLKENDAICRFRWTEKEVQFQVSRKVNQEKEEIVARWKAYSPGANIPKSNKQRFRLNLWVMGGTPLMDNQVEVVIKYFNFTPE